MPYYADLRIVARPLFSTAVSCATTNHPLRCGFQWQWWHCCCCGQKLRYPGTKKEFWWMFLGPWICAKCTSLIICYLIICYWACYARIKTDKNLSISANSQLICTKLSEQCLFFWVSQNECKKCYVTIKTDKNINISADSQPICTKLSEQGSFSEPVKMSPKSTMLGSKLNQKLTFPVGFQWSWEISLHVGHSVLTQKLKYTCRWIRFHNDLGGFNSDCILPRWQLCHKPFGFLVIVM